MPAPGHLGPLEDAFGLVRGYNVRIAGICELKALYKERWESFLANAGVVQGFAPNDLTTADWMSRRTGQTTLIAAKPARTSRPRPGNAAKASTGTRSPVRSTSRMS
jgi:type IV secretion system protein VirD4